ncbi:MAG: hypothetical protein U0931_35780 [Vulcanimicrobiota bacterium]
MNYWNSNYGHKSNWPLNRVPASENAQKLTSESLIELLRPPQLRAELRVRQPNEDKPSHT